MPKKEKDRLEKKISEQDKRINELNNHIVEINEGLKIIMNKQKGGVK